MTNELKSVSSRDYRRVFNAMKYSMQGIGATWREEAAFRQEVWFFTAVNIGDAFVHIPMTDKLLIMLTQVMVLSFELLNSGVEALVDKTCPEIHPLAGKAKDCCSAAVFLAMFAFLITWGCIIGPLLWAHL